jgi:hypothetical protein
MRQPDEEFHKYTKLLSELSRDPRLKQGIAKARRQQRGKTEAKVEILAGMFLLVSAIASRFWKKKRARAIQEMADIAQLLVQVSLALKENVFDRPEVKKFFRQSSRQIYLFAQECVAMMLPRTGSHRTEGRADRTQPSRETLHPRRASGPMPAGGRTASPSARRARSVRATV